MGDVVDFQRIEQEEIRTDLSEVFRGAIRASLEMLLEEEIKKVVGARRYERVEGRKGLRNGSYFRGLLTSLGHMEVRVPRSRDGSGNGVLERYKRRTSEVDDMITEAYVGGISTRKMGDVTTSLMGDGVSRSTVSRVTRRLEQTVEQLRTDKLEQAFPYLYLDATFIDSRWARRVENVAALVAYGVGEDGHRHLLGVSIGAQESEASWSSLLEQLIGRGLRGVKLIISDDHSGLKIATRQWLPESAHQRCTVHVQRNVMAKIPRRLQRRVLREVGQVFKADGKTAAAEALESFSIQWSKELPEAVECLQKAFKAATVFYSFPREHWRRIHTTNSIERLNREIKRRVKSVGAFPDRDSALRLVTGVAIRVCATWGDRSYLNMNAFEEKMGAQKQAA